MELAYRICFSELHSFQFDKILEINSKVLYILVAILLKGAGTKNFDGKIGWLVRKAQKRSGFGGKEWSIQVVLA